MSKFKEGDLVYYPGARTDKCTKVFQLEGCGYGRYPLGIRYDDGFSIQTFTAEGYYHITNKLPRLFHATPENKAKLEALYGMEFEKPPTAS